MPPCSGQSRPSPAGGREDAASLDRPCARRLRELAVGMEECSRRGSNQRMRPKRATKPTISNRWFSGNFRLALTSSRTVSVQTTSSRRSWRTVVADGTRKMPIGVGAKASIIVDLTCTRSRGSPIEGIAALGAAHEPLHDTGSHCAPRRLNLVSPESLLGECEGLLADDWRH